MVPGPARAGVHRRPADVKLRAQEGTLPSGTLELIAHATSKLSCADPDGATLNLYTPLFKWAAEDEEEYSASILRRMRDILARTRDNPTTAYVGALWAWAHARAYRLSLNEQCGVDRIYADGVAPEQCRTYDLSCADTAFVWEKVPLRPVAPIPVSPCSLCHRSWWTFSIQPRASPLRLAASLAKACGRSPRQVNPSA